MLPPLVSQSTTSSAPAFLRGPDRLQGEIGIALEAVEEMFGVVDHARPSARR